MTKEITALKARNFAIECLSDCFSSEQAGGFENADNAGLEWTACGIEIHSQTASGFIMSVDGHEIQIKATIKCWRADRKP